MDYEFKDCMDAGSEYCPCHLAESGDCIICSQLSGKNFCDCTNWKGVCIYQEYKLNGSQAKGERETYNCKIVKKEMHEENLHIFTLNAPKSLAARISAPGSFVFVRDPKTNCYYDTPISIMESDPEDSKIKFAIEKRGIKTKNVCLLQKGDIMTLRGPFWNGILGKKNLEAAINGTSVVICRGIGIAPAIPVLKKLYGNGNKIIVLLDSMPFRNDFSKEYMDKYEAEVHHCTVIRQGALTEEFKYLLKEIKLREKINLIHCDGPDILIHQLLNFIDQNIKFSCCNNSRMCCGEGVCGTCSTRYEGHKVKRLCKVQLDPKYIFKGRRLI